MYKFWLKLAEYKHVKISLQMNEHTEKTKLHQTKCDLKAHMSFESISQVS